MMTGFVLGMLLGAVVVAALAWLVKSDRAQARTLQAILDRLPPAEPKEKGGQRMLVYVLFGQRVCRYPGEYAPEALAVMTEYDVDENPDYLPEEERKFRADKSLASVQLVALEVDERAICEILAPSNRIVPAVVQAD